LLGEPERAAWGKGKERRGCNTRKERTPKQPAVPWGATAKSSHAIKQ